MQTAFLTDCVAVATRSATEERVDATVTLKFLDGEGRHVGTSVVRLADLTDLGGQLIRFAANTALHAVAPETFTAPERQHLVLTRDLRTAEAA